MGYFDEAKAARRGTAPVVLHLPVGPIEATPYAAAALRSEAAQLAEQTEGGRNEALNFAWYKMGQHVGAGTIDLQTVRNVLADAARSTGLPEDEIATVLRDGPTSAAYAGAANPRVPDPTPEARPFPTLASDRFTPTVIGQDTESVGTPLLNPIIDWHALFSGEEDEEEWILPPLLPARRMIALFSAPKAGKSLLMLELAVGIARGTEVLGHTPDRPRRVLYVDFENDQQGDIRPRLQDLGVGPEDLGNLCYLSFPSLAKFDTPTGAADLLRHVEAYECELVVIDTVSRAVAGEENDNDTWLAFYRNTGLMLKRAGVACVRLDHSGKDAEKGMRGGSAKYGDVDAVWKLTLTGEHTVILECTDNRMPVPAKLLTLDRGDWPLRHRLVGEGWQAAASEGAKAVIDVLDQLGVDPELPVRKVKDLLAENGYVGRGRDGKGFGANPILEAVRVRKGRLPTLSTSVSDTPPTHSDTGSPSVSQGPTSIGGPRTQGPERLGHAPPEHDGYVIGQGPRTGPAWDAAMNLLTGGGWHRWTDVVQAMLDHSDLQPTSCSNRLREALGQGLLEHRGEHPDRMLRLTPTDPDSTIRCKTCDRPTTRGHAQTHDGLCATCFRNTGQEPRP